MLKSKKISLSHNKLSASSIFILVILLVYTAFLAFLIFWAFMVAFQTTDKQIFNKCGGAYYKMPPHFELHFAEVIEKLQLNGLPGEAKQNFFDILRNSLLYSVLSAFLKTLIPCLTAYACARFNFKTGKVVYTAVLMAMIVPLVGSQSSELELVSKFVVGDYSLIIDNVIGTSLLKANMLGLYFFVFYSTFESMPKDYFEAARIDGAGNWSVLFKIAFPLVKNVFLTVFIIEFVQFWNDYQTPMVYLNHRPTLGFALWQLSFGTAGAALSNPVLAMTTVILCALPVVILFIIFKDKFMGNLTMGGIKG
ncbi:MAG: carbohydrate ABC transporter permease [Bacilli bacterium]|nr:carbohydrate ABC transporter permease [Bacilli bacterium]